MQRVELGDQVVELKHEADVLVPQARALGGVGFARDVRAVVHAPRRGGIEEPEHVEQRRLAGARGPDERDDLALHDADVDALEDRDLTRADAVALVDVLGADQGVVAHEQVGSVVAERADRIEA